MQQQPTQSQKAGLMEAIKDVYVKKSKEYLSSNSVQVKVYDDGDGQYNILIKCAKSIGYSKVRDYASALGANVQCSATMHLNTEEVTESPSTNITGPLAE